MATMNENDLLALFLEETSLRAVEPGIYSVLPDNASGNEYDTQFGAIYDWVACNPIYNRLIWGYSVKLFPQIARDALQSAGEGNLLDLGCGSLAFTAEVYSQYAGRPVVLVDQSLKMLKMAKARLVKHNGNVPGNMVLLHADALCLPFRENAFTTLLSQNLLHCLADTSLLLKQLEKIVSKNGRMYFTTLVKNNRLADRYLNALADSGKLVPRTVADHKKVFDQFAMFTQYETQGNILSIYCEC